MRVFIALIFSENEKDHLDQQIKKISDKHSGNYTKYDNLHLTLHYIGDVDQLSLEKIKINIKKIQFPSFQYKTNQLDCFKNRKNQCLVHLSVNNNLMLKKLHESVIDSLAQTNIEINKQKFTPHITLGRKVKADKKHISQYNYNAKTFFARKISIMESKRVNGQLVYAEIDFCMLQT